MASRKLKWLGYTLLTLALIGCIVWFQFFRPIPDFGRKVLVFSKTAGYRHESIEAGIEALTQLGKKQKFNVTASEDASLFSQASLDTFQAVIFLNTTGDVLNNEQQYAFQRYVQAGGGFVGIHSAADTEWEENEWPWYTRLVGAAFKSHPDVQTAELSVDNADHPATSELPGQWSASDEWYDFQRVNPQVTVLLSISETDYVDGNKGGNHPAAWYHDYDGGRAFYTALGHNAETYGDANFLQHIAGGISYAMGEGSRLDYSKAMPEDWRFKRVVLDSGMDEPVAMAFREAGDLVYIERKGGIFRFDFEVAQSIEIGRFKVYTEGEHGLLGIAFDPNYEENHWVYFLYAVEEDGEVVNRLARFNLVGDELDLDSATTVLQFPVTAGRISHTGGSMQFDHKGQLWISTGDNTIPHESDGYSPTDDRDGRTEFDAARSSGNTQDLRGKILRIIPQMDGSYTIPADNLFSDPEEGRPEIFVMGLRNPYKIFVDSQTDTLYWGEVGPDAKEHSDSRGPRGYDEFNRTQTAGNFGWPFVIGDREPYAYFDFATGESTGEFADPDAPKNRSRNNTGATVLPPAQKAWIHYPYLISEEFIELDKGGRSGMAGGVYRAEEYPDNPKKLPTYYNDKLFVFDWVRRWVKAISQDEQGNITKIEPFMADKNFSAPIDLRFAPDGSLYVLEYGSAWFSQNDDAYLSRLEYYSEDNPPPIATAKTNRKVGAVPFTANLSGADSFDRNGPADQLSFSWDLLEGGKISRNIANTREATFTADEPGEYQLQLTVTDGGGASSSAGVLLVAGNEPPTIDVEFSGGNNSFYWQDSPLRYLVTVTDLEDGSTEDDSIAANSVAITFDYLAEGMDLAQAAMGHQDAAAGAQDGMALMKDSDCLACHTVDKVSVGPSFKAIAERYTIAEHLDQLTTKVLDGGGGAWGEHAMSPHPQLNREVAEQMVSYIIDPNASSTSDENLDLQGSLEFQQHLDNFTTMDMVGDVNQGQYLMNISYRDQGFEKAPSLTARQSYRLRYPLIMAADFDAMENGMAMHVDQLGGQIVMMQTGDTPASRSHIRLDKVDLSGIEKLRIGVTTSKMITSGGELTVRLDGMDTAPVASIEVENKNIGMPSTVDYYDIPLEGIEGTHDLYLASERLKDSRGPDFIFITVEFLRQTQ
ncbi:MAG: ThuA domain-containing protein [Halioglobus sp.]